MAEVSHGFSDRPANLREATMIVGSSWTAPALAPMFALSVVSGGARESNAGEVISLVDWPLWCRPDWLAGGL